MMDAVDDHTGHTCHTVLPTMWPRAHHSATCHVTTVRHGCRVTGRRGDSAVSQATVPCVMCDGHGIVTIDHDLTNLAPVHDRTWPHCHRRKTSMEGRAARRPERRPTVIHPGLLGGVAPPHRGAGSPERTAARCAPGLK